MWVVTPTVIVFRAYRRRVISIGLVACSDPPTSKVADGADTGAVSESAADSGSADTAAAVDTVDTSADTGRDSAADTARDTATDSGTDTGESDVWVDCGRWSGFAGGVLTWTWQATDDATRAMVLSAWPGDWVGHPEASTVLQGPAEAEDGLFERDVAFRCDDDGAWLQQDLSWYTRIEGGYASSDYKGSTCEDGELLLIPRELDVASSWSSSCIGHYIRWNGSDFHEDCDYTFTVVAQETVETPAGSWDALRVENVQNSYCYQTIGTYWLAEGLGIVAFEGWSTTFGEWELLDAP